MPGTRFGWEGWQHVLGSLFFTLRTCFFNPSFFLNPQTLLANRRREPCFSNPEKSFLFNPSPCFFTLCLVFFTLRLVFFTRELACFTPHLVFLTLNLK